MSACAPSSLSPAPLTTARLCAAAEVTRGMLRLYEREGLLPAPRRTGANYRHYPDDALARLQAIKLLKEVGFTLREIALLLAEHDAGSIDPGRLRELAQAQLAQIDARISRLALVRSYVADVAAGHVGRVSDPECRFLVDFLAAGAAPQRTAAGTPAPVARSSPQAPGGTAGHAGAGAC